MKWFSKFSLEHEEKFWSKVSTGNINTCWEWLSYKTKDGYGRFFVVDQHVSAHRVSAALHGLDISLCICHSCDNPGCVNPAHLFPGSHLDNMRDRNSKGRHVDNAMENHGKCIIKQKDAEEILRSFQKGETVVSLRDRYGYSYGSVYNICKGYTWGRL